MFKHQTINNQIIFDLDIKFNINTNNFNLKIKFLEYLQLFITGGTHIFYQSSTFYAAISKIF